VSPGPFLMTDNELLTAVLAELVELNATADKLHFVLVAVGMAGGFIAGQISWLLLLRVRDEYGAWGD